MSEGRSGPPRIPAPSGGIQVNHCKKPACINFGVPAAGRRGAVEPGSARGRYAVVGATATTKALLCHGCRTYTTIRSNKAIKEELDRFNRQRSRSAGASCPQESCGNFGRSPIDSPSTYYRHGHTKTGEPRLRCRLCGSTFSAGAPVRTQKRPELNAEVARLLVNKMPMRRICETLGIHPATLYSKVAYVAEVASAFLELRERPLADPATAPKRAYVSVDRQDHMLNWATQLDRRNIHLGALGAVENDSGYVLGLQLTFDPNVDPEDIEADAIRRGDYDVVPAYRHHARVWLRKDYDRPRAPMEAQDDLGPFEPIAPESKAPPSGMQVRLECTQYALFFHLKKLLTGVERVRFFMDRDPGMDGACMSAFCEDVSARRVDAFLIKSAKTMTIDAKKRRVAQGTREADRLRAANPTVSDGDLRSLVVRTKLEAHRASPAKSDWFAYPLADMAEPEKAILYITDYGDHDIEHLTRLYMRATLRGIDRFYMQVRRRLSLLERPIATANNARRVWHGYAAYSPRVAEQVLLIFRAYYNYCLIGEDRKTPAMRLGLATHPVTLEDLARGPSSVSPGGNK